MKDSCRIYLVTESLTKCNIMLQFCKSTNSGKTIYLFCILFAFICLQNSSMHPVFECGAGQMAHEFEQDATWVNKHK